MHIDNCSFANNAGVKFNNGVGFAGKDMSPVGPLNPSLVVVRLRLHSCEVNKVTCQP